METVWMLCLVLTGCALVYSKDPLCPEAENCVTAVKLALSTKNFTLYCKALSKGGECLVAVGKQCPGLMKIDLIQQVKLSAMELDTGCDGKCGESFAHCFDPIANAFSPNMEANATVCKMEKTAFACMKKEDSKACTTGVKKSLNSFAKKYFKGCDGASSLIFSTVVLVLGATVASLKNYI